MTTVRHVNVLPLFYYIVHDHHHHHHHHHHHLTHVHSLSLFYNVVQVKNSPALLLVVVMYVIFVTIILTVQYSKVQYCTILVKD